MKSEKDCRNKLITQLIDFAWRQWTSLGVPGNRMPVGDWIIDPEALVLVTTEIGRYDSRLLDCAIDWLLVNGQSINVQRLRSLQGMWGLGDSCVLEAIAEILSKRSVLRKWQHKGGMIYLSDPPEPLFITPEGAGMPVFDDPDPHFRKYGLLRNRWEPRSNAQAPSPMLPGNLLLTLRALFGVTARAEIMAWLLTHREGHPAAIAKDTGYFTKSIESTLNEMLASGQIRTEKDGRKKIVRLRHEDWSFLITWPGNGNFPRWAHWPTVHYYALRTIQLLGKSGTEGASDNLRAIQLRGFLDEVTPKLRESSLEEHLTAHSDLKGSQLVEAVLQDAMTLGDLLDSDFALDRSSD